jgi:rhodanese-related sulfurtransferase
MYEILPGLYLASFNDVRQRGAEAQEYFIINCSRDLPMLSPTGVRLAIDDAPQENERMLGFFPRATQLIRRKLREGDEVIVHCWAGQQRSAAVMAAYLMKYAHMSKDHAMRFIRRQKPDAFSWGATFDPALEDWENNMV